MHRFIRHPQSLSKASRRATKCFGCLIAIAAIPLLTRRGTAPLCGRVVRDRAARARLHARDPAAALDARRHVAMRECMTGTVTSVFFSLSMVGRERFFHGYCDLSDRSSSERTMQAIIERELRPVKAMTREEPLEHIWSSTHDDYRGYAGDRLPDALQGKRTVLVFCGGWARC